MMMDAMGTTRGPGLSAQTPLGILPPEDAW